MRVPLRLVLDTNVVLEIFHFNDPATASLRALIESGDALCFACPRTLAELAHVVPRPAFKLDAQAATRVVETYRSLCIEAADPPALAALAQCKDTSDQKFIELAVSVGADFLITRDKAVLKLAKRLAKQAPLRVVLPEKLPPPNTLGIHVPATA